MEESYESEDDLTEKDLFGTDTNTETYFVDADDISMSSEDDKEDKNDNTLIKSEEDIPNDDEIQENDSEMTMIRTTTEDEFGDIESTHDSVDNSDENDHEQHDEEVKEDAEEDEIDIKQTKKEGPGEMPPILAEGEFMRKIDFANGSKYNYCFKSVKKKDCDAEFAKARCGAVRNYHDCLTRERGCQFRFKPQEKKCCLMYSCVSRQQTMATTTTDTVERESSGNKEEGIQEEEASGRSTIIAEEIEDTTETNTKTEESAEFEDETEKYCLDNRNNTEPECATENGKWCKSKKCSSRQGADGVTYKVRETCTYTNEDGECCMFHECIPYRDDTEDMGSPDSKETKANSKIVEDQEENGSARIITEEESDFLFKSIKEGEETTHPDIDELNERYGPTKSDEDGGKLLEASGSDETPEVGVTNSKDVEEKDAGGESSADYPSSEEDVEKDFDQSEAEVTQCVNELISSDECEEKARTWCVEQQCFGLVLGQCQIDIENGTCCMRHICTKDKMMDEEDTESMTETTSSFHVEIKESEDDQMTNRLLGGNEEDSTEKANTTQGNDDTGSGDAVKDILGEDPDKDRFNFDRKLNKDGEGAISDVHKNIVTDIKEGETIVHYFYRGVSDLTDALRPHHCSPSPLCMVSESLTSTHEVIILIVYRFWKTRTFAMVLSFNAQLITPVRGCSVTVWWIHLVGQLQRKVNQL